MLSSPLISVVIPTFNQSQFLSAALTSVLEQSYSHLEILVIDDGSTDATSTIGTFYSSKDSRIKWIKQPNRGPSNARNRGIALAKGDYICLLDSDDVMHPERIAHQYKVLQQDKSVDIVYTALYFIDAQGDFISEMKGQDYSSSDDFLALMFFRNLIPGPSTILAKSLCLKNHPYQASFKHAEDYELMMRLAHLYHFRYLDLPLTSYRRHANNLSNDLEKHLQAELKVLHTYSPAHIEKVIEQTSFTNEEKNLLKGKIQFKQGNIQNALVIFQGCSTSLAFFYTGNCYLHSQQFTLAISAFQKAIVLDNTHPACYNNLGVAYAQLGQIELAQEFFQQALLLKSNYLDAQLNLKQFSDCSHKWWITWRELRTQLVPYHQIIK